MTLRNTEYRISFSSKKTGRFYYYFAKDKSGWYQVTAAGNRHQATAEQVKAAAGGGEAVDQAVRQPCDGRL